MRERVPAAEAARMAVRMAVEHELTQRRTLISISVADAALRRMKRSELELLLRDFFAEATAEALSAFDRMQRDA